MQIMLMTQLLKDTEETADGEPEEGAKNIILSHLNLKISHARKIKALKKKGI